eukprot:15464684-Alexandrium_andersonii.AAC.1
MWVPGSLGVWASGRLGVWVSGCLGVWMSGCLGVWASGRQGVWVWPDVGVDAGGWVCLRLPICRSLSPSPKLSLRAASKCVHSDTTPCMYPFAPLLTIVLSISLFLSLCLCPNSVETTLIRSRPLRTRTRKQ